MNPFFQKLIFETVKHRLKKKNKKTDDRQLLNEVNSFKVNITHIVRDTVLS